MADEPIKPTDAPVPTQVREPLPVTDWGRPMNLPPGTGFGITIPRGPSKPKAKAK